MRKGLIVEPSVIVATMHPKPEHFDEVVGHVIDAAAGFHGEPGCILYAPHRDEENLVIIEKWATRDEQRAHAEGPLLAALRAKIGPLVQGPSDILRVVPLTTGSQPVAL